MCEEYPKRRFTIQLEYTVSVPESYTDTQTIEANTAEEAVEVAWEKLYDANGYDDEILDEDNASVVKEEVIPGRGYEDTKTVDMFDAKD